VAAVEDQCEVASLTRAHECGLLAEPGNPRALADQILVFYRDRALAERAGANARALGLSFDRRGQVTRYMDLFRQILASPAPEGSAAGTRPALTPQPQPPASAGAAETWRGPRG
jgi:hypothetical protein